MKGAKEFVSARKDFTESMYMLWEKRQWGEKCISLGKRPYFHALFQGIHETREELREKGSSETEVWAHIFHSKVVGGKKVRMGFQNFP